MCSVLKVMWFEKKVGSSVFSVRHKTTYTSKTHSPEMSSIPAVKPNFQLISNISRTALMTQARSEKLHLEDEELQRC